MVRLRGWTWSIKHSCCFKCNKQTSKATDQGHRCLGKALILRTDSHPSFTLKGLPFTVASSRGEPVLSIIGRSLILLRSADASPPSAGPGPACSIGWRSPPAACSPRRRRRSEPAGGSRAGPGLPGGSSHTPAEDHSGHMGVRAVRRHQGKSRKRYTPSRCRWGYRCGAPPSSSSYSSSGGLEEGRASRRGLGLCRPAGAAAHTNTEKQVSRPRKRVVVQSW